MVPVRVLVRDAQDLVVLAGLVAVRKTAIALTGIRMPGNVGAPTQTIASSAEPFSVSVPWMKP